jgi:GNAT superfamily N-acetyltransferase
MMIKLALTDLEVDRCFPVMAQLRPHLDRQTFLRQVAYQREHEQFHLAYVEEQDTVVAVSGFRLMSKLAGGRTLYVDDLVTAAEYRSQGYGDRLVDWLADYGRSHQCQQLTLDSGVHRVEAHRFYFRKRMGIMGYHFHLPLE